MARLNDANAQIVQMNKSYTEMKEYEGCEELVGISLDKTEYAKNAEIAALKALLEEHGISSVSQNEAIVWLR